jgi:hypothetical protein
MALTRREIREFAVAWMEAGVELHLDAEDSQSQRHSSSAMSIHLPLGDCC